MSAAWGAKPEKRAIMDSRLQASSLLQETSLRAQLSLHRHGLRQHLCFKSRQPTTHADMQACTAHAFAAASDCLPADDSMTAVMQGKRFGYFGPPYWGLAWLWAPMDCGLVPCIACTVAGPLWMQNQPLLNALLATLCDLPGLTWTAQPTLHNHRALQQRLLCPGAAGECSTTNPLANNEEACKTM